MPLKIIGVGFGRTGTESLYTALNQLGYPCYHMFEVLRNKARVASSSRQTTQAGLSTAAV